MYVTMSLIWFIVVFVVLVALLVSHVWHVYRLRKMRITLHLASISLEFISRDNPDLNMNQLFDAAKAEYLRRFGHGKRH